ncbi:hypothetical protein Pelo_19226 [Pelomyxa schiedti]|nr:hypothetical protein Pelo_19226 [Pelomyxa schiedti]
MLHERALVAVSTSTSGDTTGSRCRGKQVNDLPPSALGSQPGTTQRGRDSSSPSVISVQCPVAGCGATSARVCDVSTLVSDASASEYLLQVTKDKEEEGLCMLGYCMDENSAAKKATLTCSKCKGLLFCELCFDIHHKAPRFKSHKNQ